MATINFTGLASGIDTKALIEAILDVERQPIQRLQERQSLFNSRKAAFDELRGKLNSFEDALRSLSSEQTFRGRTTSVADETVLRATAGAGAETGVFTVDVTSLAAADKFKSDGFSAKDESLVSEGTITIQSGENELITIDVTSSGFTNTLEGVRDAINGADAGVEASIIFDGADYRLTVRSSETGLDNALAITDGTNLNLTGAGNQVTFAADAALVVDGIAVTSGTNSVADVIPGVTLELLSEGSSTTVEVAQDLDGVVDAAETLVEKYNDLRSFFTGQDSRDSPGPLAGDSVLRRVQQRVQGLFNSGLAGIPVGGIRSLSSIGVEFSGETGQASLDSAQLRELLEQQFDDVGNLFLTSGKASDPRIQFVGASGQTVDGVYDVEILSVLAPATLVGSTPISSLGQDEELTITVNGDSSVVSLAQGLTIDAIVDRVNLALGIDGVPASASNDGGKLRITTDDSGSDVSLTIVSDRNDNGNGQRTGFDDTPATDVGEDLSGTIGGVAATAEGNLLIGAEGTDYAGITVKTAVTATDLVETGGAFGTVSYSRGLIDTLVNEIDSLTKFGSGPIGLAQESLTADVERLAADIERIEDRLIVREARLIKTFTAAENAISLLQAQQSQLGSVS